MPTYAYTYMYIPIAKLHAYSRTGIPVRVQQENSKGRDTCKENLLINLNDAHDHLISFAMCTSIAHPMARVVLF